jgi:predicted signal transduction protein with EAL and GGDEF domain
VARILSGTHYAEVRGALFESLRPSVEELARVPMHVEELDQVLARMHTSWLVKLFASDSLYVVFQSLISVAIRICVACECLVPDNHDGTPIRAESLLSLSGMRRQQGRVLMKNGPALFLNFTLSSIYKSTFDVKKTKTMCSEMGVHISQLVFEATEAEKVRDFDFLKSVMPEYRAEGANRALGDLASGYSLIRLRQA